MEIFAAAFAVFCLSVFAYKLCSPDSEVLCPDCDTILVVTGEYDDEYYWCTCPYCGKQLKVKKSEFKKKRP